MHGVRLIGAGKFLPKRVVTNERLVRAIPGWPAARIEEKTGIRERRYLWDFDEKEGRALIPPEDDAIYPRTNTDMCEVALREALTMSALPASALDAIFVVTVSPDELNFCHDAIGLHDRLGCRDDAYALVVDSGCGGGLYLVDMAVRAIRSGALGTVAIVGSTLTSAYLDREVFTSELPGKKGINAFLSMYLFGDGAGAVILRRDTVRELGVVATTGRTVPGTLVTRRGGGAMCPPHPGRATPADHAYIVDGPEVARAYPAHMERVIRSLWEAAPEVSDRIERYYLHQSNKRLLEGLVDQLGIPKDKVPVHVDRYGNTSAASTFVALAEDLEAGRVQLGTGTPVMFAAVGAGVHAGGQVVRL